MRTGSFSQAKGAKSPTTSENSDDADDSDSNDGDPVKETKPNDTSGNEAKNNIPRHSFNDSESFSTSD